MAAPATRQEKKNIERDRERETATFLFEMTIAVRLLSDY